MRGKNPHIFKWKEKNYNSHFYMVGHLDTSILFDLSSANHTKQQLSCPRKGKGGIKVRKNYLNKNDRKRRHTSRKSDRQTHGTFWKNISG